MLLVAMSGAPSSVLAPTMTFSVEPKYDALVPSSDALVTSIASSY